MVDSVKLSVNGVSVAVPAGAMVSAAVAIAGVDGFRRSVNGQPRVRYAAWESASSAA